MFKHIKTQPNLKSRYNLYFEGGKEMKKVKFFYCTRGNFCYMPSKRRKNGFIVPNEWFNTIQVMEEIIPRVYSVADNAKSVLRKLHPNCWDNLKERLEAVVESGENGREYFLDNPNGLTFRNINSLLNTEQKAEVKKAFDNKADFSFIRYGNRRDLSISTKLCKDGVFRAWFSSEYSGCGNGSYYLLLNPTTAVHYEND